MAPSSDVNEAFPNEAFLLEHIYAGQPAILPKEKEAINASYLRKHILEVGLQQEGGKSRGVVRWEIHNATFAGKLDLQDGCRAGGGSLPAFQFVNCEFGEGFCADGAKIERLSFDECRFTSADSPEAPGKNSISLRNCRIKTELSIENLRPVATLDEGSHNGMLLWIDAFAISVGTNIVVKNTFLRSPRNQSSETEPEPRYALDLSTADIHCDLRLQPNVFLEGGLKMRDARIGGTVWAQALYATDGEDANSRTKIGRGEPRAAVRADRAHIRGDLVLSAIEKEDANYQKVVDSVYPKKTNPDPAHDSIERDPLRVWCVGAVNLAGLQTQGQLWLSGARINGPAQLSLGLDAARIGGSLRADAVIPLAVQRVSKFEDAQKFSLKTSNFSLRACRISGDCEMELDCGTLVAAGMVVAGSLGFTGKVRSLHAAGLEVGRDAVLTIEDLGLCNLGGSNVKGKLDISGIRFSGTPEPFHMMSLRDADIGHALVVAPDYSDIRRVKQQDLTCYKGFKLSQIELSASFTEARVASFLHREKCVVLLTGKPERLYDLNREIGLDLRDEHTAAEYLRLFCAYVWGKYGAFVLIEEAKALPGAFRDRDKEIHHVKLNEREVSIPGKVFYFDAFVKYGAFLFKSTFKVCKDGQVEMIDDEPVSVDGQSVVYEPYERRNYASPFRFATLNDIPDFDSESAKLARWIKPNAFKREIPNWSELLMQEMQDQLTGVKFDLRDASCSTLSDNIGKVWENARPPDLEGFTYDRTFQTPGTDAKHEVEVRLRWFIRETRQSVWHRFYYWIDAASRWIRRQLLRRSESEDQSRPFRAQPYAQLAKVFRQRGDEESARNVEASKIKNAARDRADELSGCIFMPWWWFYGFFFKFGISPGRALSTLIFVWLLGFGAIKLLDDSDLLRANVNITALAATVKPGKELIPLVVSVPPEMAPDLPCHDAIAPALYAAELMIPVLNLHQQSRCEIHEVPPSAHNDSKLKFGERNFRVPHMLVIPRTWEYLRAIYLLLATIVTSLALLTFSGIARRWEQ